MAEVIKNVKGRMVYDSRGKPTIEAEVITTSGHIGRAIAPAGTSKGQREAHDKRDMDKSHDGLGVTKAIFHVNNTIKNAMIGLNIEDQKKVDKTLIDLDGTKNKSNLGGNSTIAVSMAAIKTAANSQDLDLWNYLNTNKNASLPLPEIQILGGGAHAKNSIDIQDLMIIPNNAPDYITALEWVSDIYRKAGEILDSEGRLYGVADEGGYWPLFKNNESALEFLTNVIEKTGLIPLQDVSISIDVAASNFYKNGKYKLNKGQKTLHPEQFLEKIINWIKHYPIISIEDPFNENDYSSFSELKKTTPDYLQIVGDDLITTDKSAIISAVKKNAINCALIKPNQIGTISETKEAVDTSVSLGIGTIMSARSGESEDTTIVDLCIGWNIPQLKVGSISRSE